MKFDIFCIAENETLLCALKKIDENKKGFLLVIDDGNRVLGTLTDGDIRRAFINETNINDEVANVYIKKFERVLIDDEFSKIIEYFKDNRIKFLPIVDWQGKLMNIITKSNMHVLLLEDIVFGLDYDFLSLDEDKLEHEIFNRPWGLYKTTFLNPYSQSKIIKVKPLGELSLQEHKRREEYWVIIYGMGEVIIGESKKRVESGNYVYIPKGCKHKLINTSEDSSLMVAEVQLGDYFGEDDIIRYQDIYGRK
ncbi:CBS domain-containing protein [Desulfosporosinus sp. OT]|uniref:CBS domain-containing protein n=1 Tax=Desulfosporosinus sp. OT TaxID=913865 RepID=UPI000223A362|nr:CBS domain-containing protein [Desulfosporosinus sp. OT]EGW36526.1 CBS domain pair family protein [Desulfosporosinus sp. OT]